MSTQSFELAFFTIGELEGLSGDATTRTAHIDIPADCLTVAATLQSARQWLAVRLARHSRNGWDAPNAQPALKDDIAGVAQLLTLSEEAATRLVMLEPSGRITVLKAKC